MNADAMPRKATGGRPKGDPAARRSSTIGVRVSASEYAALREKAAQLRMTPAQWLRESVTVAAPALPSR
jgi:hypothetical protein